MWTVELIVCFHKDEAFSRNNANHHQSNVLLPGILGVLSTP